MQFHLPRVSTTNSHLMAFNLSSLFGLLELSIISQQWKVHLSATNDHRSTSNTRSQLQETSMPNYKKGCYRHPISKQSRIIQTISDQAIKENTQAKKHKFKLKIKSICNSTKSRLHL